MLLYLHLTNEVCVYPNAQRNISIGVSLALPDDKVTDLGSYSLILVPDVNQLL